MDTFSEVLKKYIPKLLLIMYRLAVLFWLCAIWAAVCRIGNVLGAIP